jgi:hypothetical protein
VLESGNLNFLWSEVEWPLASDSIQSDAVEFHRVITHAFSQTAVVPFRLLTVFDNVLALENFAAGVQNDFLADLERLKNMVQMECVIYFKPARDADRSSGQAYLRQKAEVRRGIDEYINALKDSLTSVARDIRIREVNTGNRIFCLVGRGQEAGFRTKVEGIAVPAGLERRLSGPWPPAEFLSDAVKTPATNRE